MPQPRKGSDYSLEDLHGQFKVFGEGQKDLCQRVERIEQKLEKLDVIETKVFQIESFLRPLAAQVSDHEHRINSHEKRLTAIEKAG